MSTQPLFQPVLERSLHHALGYLNSLADGPVSASATLEHLRGRLAKPLAELGSEPSRVIDELAADVAGGLLGCAGGRFYAWVIGGSLPAALGADWLTSA